MALSHALSQQTETQQRDHTVINRVSGDQPAGKWSPPRMPPGQGNCLPGTGLAQEAKNYIAAGDIEDGAASDEGRKVVMKKVLLDPFERAGYDFDVTLRDFASRLRAGNLPRDQAAAVMRMMRVYGEQVADLARWGLIKVETRDLVISALKIKIDP